MKIDELKENAEIKICQYEIPTVKSGVVYFICEDDNEVIYIGASINFKTRIKDHIKRPEFCNKKYFFFSVDINELCNTERRLIRNFKPKYNKAVWGDLTDKQLLQPIKNPLVNCDFIKKEIKTLMRKKKVSYQKAATYLGFTRQWLNFLLNSKSMEKQVTYERLTKLLGFLNEPKAKLAMIEPQKKGK